MFVTTTTMSHLRGNNQKQDEISQLQIIGAINLTFLTFLIKQHKIFTEVYEITEKSINKNTIMICTKMN